MIVFLLVILTLTDIVAAANISSFMIQISPNPMKPAEAVDMTIKALQSDWSIATDYKGTIIMWFEWQQDTTAYDLPNDGFYQFSAEDQWVKTFSKGLTIKKTGQYVLKVYDAVESSIVWSLPVVVWSKDNSDTIGIKIIELLEPLSWSMVKWSALNVIGKTDNRKTPLQFFIDDKKLTTEWETDDTGNFSVYLTDIAAWAHTLQVKMVDYEWKILWQSEIIKFNYTLPPTDWFLKSFVATPDWELNIWDEVVFDAQVDGTVRNIELKIWTLGTFIMDRSASGVFNKTVIVDKSGTNRVDVTLIFEWWQKTIYADRATLNIKSMSGIGTLKVVNNIADPSQVWLSWTSVGTPVSYIIRYGQSKDALTGEIKTTLTNTQIESLEIGKQYFFQVFGVDETWSISDKWSDIASLTTQWQSAAWDNIIWSSCTVVGIKIRTEKIWDQYFLIWDPVPWAVEYHIYKSDYEVNNIQNMQKVWSTTVAQFAYPFDSTAKKDEYKFYSVVATCSDWQNLQIDSVKKVHTWPLSDMIILFFVSLMSYFLYRIYRYN